MDLSPEAGGAAERRDRRQTRERRQHSFYRQNYLSSSLSNSLSKYDVTALNVSDPGPSSSQSPRQPMPRNDSSRSAGKRPMRAMTPQEKMDAIGRVHSGESKAAVARDIGVPESTLRGWCKAEDKIRNQLNNVRGSATYEHILSSSSDNSDNSRPGSSRSTPPTQHTMGISTSGAVERSSEEPEAGPALKRAKLENNVLTSTAAVVAAAAAAMNMNCSMPTSTQTSTITNDPIYSQYIYSLLANCPEKTLSLFSDPGKALAFFTSLLQPENLALLCYPGYISSTSNLLIAEAIAQLQRSNGVMPSMTMTTNVLPTNNMQVNGKRKYHVLNPTMEAPTRVATRRQNDQSPNVERPSGSISQPSNSRTSPLPSTSGNNGEIVNTFTRSPKDSKKLNNIICQLQQRGDAYRDVSRVCNIEMMSSNAMNNNNNNVDHVNNESTNRKSSREFPPGFSDMIMYCTKLIDWLRTYGTPICTFNEVKEVKKILDSLNKWANSKEPKTTTNDTS